MNSDDSVSQLVKLALELASDGNADPVNEVAAMMLVTAAACLCDDRREFLDDAFSAAVAVFDVNGAPRTTWPDGHTDLADGPQDA